MEPELHVDDVARAAERLAGIANITPELTSRTLDERFDAHLRLKAECFQRTGSFKFRGAYNAIAALPLMNAPRCGDVLLRQPRTGDRACRCVARHSGGDRDAR